MRLLRHWDFRSPGIFLKYLKRNVGVRLPSTVIKTEDILNKRVGKETGEYESGEHENKSSFV